MSTPPPRPTPRTLLLVAAWGAATVSVAYLVSGGSLPVFVAVMVAIGILQRVLAVRAARRRGHHPPHWWQI